MYKKIELPLRIAGGLLDEPYEKGQVSVKFFGILEQIQDNFDDLVDESGNIRIKRDSMYNARDGIVMINRGIPIWFDATFGVWKDFSGNVINKE